MFCHNLKQYDHSYEIVCTYGGLENHTLLRPHTILFFLLYSVDIFTAKWYALHVCTCDIHTDDLSNRNRLYEIITIYLCHNDHLLSHPYEIAYRNSCHIDEIVSHPYGIPILYVCHTYEMESDLISYGRLN